MDCSLPDTSVSGDSPGKNTRVGYHAFLIKNIINLILVLTSGDVHVWSHLLCCWKRVFAMTSMFSWQNSVMNYYRYANQNHNKVSLAPSVKGHHEKNLQTIIG